MEIRILEAHLASAQAEAVVGALVSEEAVSVAEAPVAASKYNKGRVFGLSIFYFALFILLLKIDSALEVLNACLLIEINKPILMPTFIKITTPFFRKVLNIVLVLRVTKCCSILQVISVTFLWDIYS